MNTYDVTTKMAINSRPRHYIIDAENERQAKYKAKKSARTADGQYPKVTSIDLICKLYSDGKGGWYSIPE
jgi:hypothetical protein